ncbi:MAG: hypothetical protein VR78_10970 [Hoeflea sp. BRH_c9]|nr:MAG: hypothetical protein VR78_10970 [Hoeflea sp. BRH_c9]
MDQLDKMTPRLISITEALDQMGITIYTYRLDPMRYPPAAEGTADGRSRRMMMNLDVTTYVLSRGKYRSLYDFSMARRAAAKQGVELIIGAPDDIPAPARVLEVA